MRWHWARSQSSEANRYRLNIEHGSANTQTREFMLIKNFRELLSTAAAIPGKRIVVIAPGNAETFEAVRLARQQLGASCILVGDRNTIERGLAAQDIGRTDVEIVHHQDTQSALAAAIAIAREGQGDILMKGSIDTSSMMKGVLQQDSGLRTGRLLSDVFVFEYPERKGNALVMITDGGITPAPDLKTKVDLINNAVDVAHALGNPSPRVAILSATEFVQVGIPSTLDAAALTKMNDRGQITGCVVDGPLALDNALSPEAADEKGIKSPVAGHAEILVAPSIEAANSLAKGTTYFGNYLSAHVIVGATLPILIPSRADKSTAKLHSIALGIIMSDSSGD